jgi:hypothetical protein
MKIWDIQFRIDRPKNQSAMLELEFTSLQRRTVIESLETIDFSSGPLSDSLNNLSPMWIFGKQVKNKEVYIKITMGTINNPVICISFHVAEYPMKYPFRK